MKTKHQLTITYQGRKAQISISSTPTNQKYVLIGLGIVSMFFLYLVVWNTETEPLRNWYLLLLLCGEWIIHPYIHALFLIILSPNRYRTVHLESIKKVIQTECYCKKQLNIWKFSVAYGAPFVLLALPLLGYGLAYGYLNYFLLGILFTIHSMDDLYILWVLSIFDRNDYVVEQAARVKRNML